MRTLVLALVASLPAVAADLDQVCSLVTRAELEAVVGAKVEGLDAAYARQSPFPRNTDFPGLICRASTPGMWITVSLAQRRAGDAKPPAPITCSSHPVPENAQRSAGYYASTGCGVVKGDQAAGIAVYAKTKADVLQIPKLRPIVEKMAERMPGRSCEDLKLVSLPHAAVTGERVVNASCRVALTLRPSNDSDIKVEIWLPTAGWNGKYQAVGNGGWSGSINTRALEQAVRRGYAASSTDTGHSGGSASFALGHPEKLLDYAYRSEHEMAVVSKQIVEAFYDHPPAHSYWNGCSAGGKQALKEAQRYPGDFDGIIAGAPASNWTGRAAQSIWAAQAVHKDEASHIPPAKYRLIHDAVLAACDGLDGVRDGVLEDPTRCKFDPKVLECQDGATTGCLLPEQVEAARRIYGPSINPRTRQPVYRGLERGSELGWQRWSGPKPLSIGTDYFKYVVLENPDWDYMTLDFDRDVARAEKLDANRINALDPDLRPFFARGGKLIQYHGWSDPQIAPGNSEDYYRSVLKFFGDADKVRESYRLFMVPGMGHCGGGEGTSTFDMLAALEQWVEEKKPPERIVASRTQDGKVDRTRPLCPYPQTAHYKGSGSSDDAANFVCSDH